MTKTPPLSRAFGAGRSRAPEPFRIKWEGKVKNWGIPNPGHLPLPVVCRTITEVLNRNGGRNFLLPSLSRASGFEVSADKVDRELSILRFQEGSNSGVFRVTANVALPDQGKKCVSFCLDACRSPQLNDEQAETFRTIQHLRGRDPRFIAEPYVLKAASYAHGGRRGELAVYSSEWLDGYTEVNMFNLDEDPMHTGLEALGIRKVRLNNPFRERFEEGIIDDDAMADAIAEEMVRILTLYFDPQTAKAVWYYGINAGDFVYKANPDGAPNLKLITARKIMDLPSMGPDKDSVNAFAFIEELLFHQEPSVHHQVWASPMNAYKYAIYAFTPEDVCRGLKKALVEKYGAEAARTKLLHWLGSFLAINQLAIRAAGGYRDKAHQDRDAMVTLGINQFLKREGYPPGRITIEI